MARQGASAIPLARTEREWFPTSVVAQGVFCRLLFPVRGGRLAKNPSNINEKNGAAGDNRNHDPPLTKGVLYH